MCANFATTTTKMSNARNLGLNHPKFSQVATGEGVLGTEGGAESVDVAHAAAKRLDVELAAYGEVGMLGKKIFAKINGSVFVARFVAYVLAVLCCSVM